MGFYERLGALVSTARAERGFTQAQLSSKIGLTRSSVANIEVGSQAVTVQLLVRIASALGKEPAALIPPPEPSDGLRDSLATAPVQMSEGLIQQIEKQFESRGVKNARTSRKGGSGSS